MIKAGPFSRGTGIRSGFPIVIVRRKQRAKNQKRKRI